MQFVELYYENVKAHLFERKFCVADAEKKIDDLIEYIDQDKAYLFYVIADKTIMGFIWFHPIKYKGNNRLYIHAYVVAPQVRGNGLASMLYERITHYPFDAKEIYTHVDASNKVSCHIQEKFGFVAEVYQYCKQIS